MPIARRPLLRDVAPRLAQALEASLRRADRADLADNVVGLQVWSGDGPVYFVPPSSIEHPSPHRGGVSGDRSYMYHPGRQSHWLRVPGRRWILRVEEIDGGLAVLDVSHPGVLRTELDALRDVPPPPSPSDDH